MPPDPITSETLAGAELVKRERKSREVPKVRVYAVHDPDCRWAGESTRISCKCRKQLKYFQNGKRIVLAADIDKNKAEEQARELENQLAAIARGEQPKPVVTGKTISEAIKLYCDSKTECTEKHAARLRQELSEFNTWCDSQNLTALVAVMSEHILQYRNQLGGAQSVRRHRMFHLVSFFSFAVEMNWITRNPAKIKAARIPEAQDQTPRALTDKQYDDFLACARQINGRSTDQQREAFRSLIVLQRWTGLAIRDAVTIERSAFSKNGEGFWKVFLRRAKTGNPVYCTLAPETYAQIMRGAKTGGRYLFIDSIPAGERELNNLIKSWGKLYTAASDIAKIQDENGAAQNVTSHWMRHTFVRWCLDHDLPTEDIAMLIGDTVAVVAKHYSDWIAGRQERLSQRMMTALTESASA